MWVVHLGKSKRNFTRLKFIKIGSIPGCFKVYDKFSQMQFLSQLKSEDKNKFHFKWNKKMKARFYVDFFVLDRRIKKGTFFGKMDIVGISICYLKI